MLGVKHHPSLWMSQKDCPGKSQYAFPSYKQMSGNRRVLKEMRGSAELKKQNPISSSWLMKYNKCFLSFVFPLEEIDNVLKSQIKQTM